MYILKYNFSSKVVLAAILRSFKRYIRRVCILQSIELDCLMNQSWEREDVNEFRHY